MPVLISEESVDTIDRELTGLSMPETEVLQASRASIDAIDTEIENRLENTPPANTTTDRVEQPIAGAANCRSR